MKVPKQYWEEAVSKACFLINCMLSTVLVGNMPNNVSFSKQVTISGVTLRCLGAHVIFEMFDHLFSS